MTPTFARLARLAADLSREPDGRLLDRFLAGSQPAFRELVTRHGPLVFAVCRRVLGHRQDAEDAFQAAFLVLARRAGDVWPRDAVGSWLYGVAHRVALKARTARARRSVRQRPLEDVAGSPPPAPEPDLAEVIDRAVRRLPEAYRAAVVACDLEGLSRAEAAERLGWKEGTLSGRLFRARQLLADRLRKAGLSAPAGGLAVALGTHGPVRAGLAEAVVELVTADAVGGVPPPVAALTEGVVTSMVAFKLKAAAVLVACALGVGAWAAGDGPGPGTAAAPAKAKPADPPPKPSAGLEQLQGRWRVDALTRGGEPDRALDPENPPVAVIAGDVLRLPFHAANGWNSDDYTVTVDETRSPGWIDLAPAPGRPAEKGLYELTGGGLTCGRCHAGGPPGRVQFKDLTGLCEPALKVALGVPGVELRLAIGTGGKRPAALGGKDGVEVRLTRLAEPADGEAGRRRMLRAFLDADLADVRGGADGHRDFPRRFRAAEAAHNLEAARAAVAQAAAAPALARAQSQQAEAAHLKAKFVLEWAEKEFAAANGNGPRPAKDEPTFTVHVRPQLAAEKVIRVKATGKETVLEGLAYAAEDIKLKSDGLSVWVVRAGAVLPVDLAAITQKGDPKTNHVLKPGDQLFVQVKVGR